MSSGDILDLLVIGGGINGAGVARDAAGRTANGRPLKVALVEAGDLASGTSSASTKLVHGGLRYLEFHAWGLVRKALQEREVILDIAPHIAWPMPFLLPLEPHLRPGWMIRAGLFLYDNLARRHEIPRSGALDLTRDAAGPAFAPSLKRAFRYWDGWVDDARLVVLNAVDAQARGAEIITRDGVTGAHRDPDGFWKVALASGRLLCARQLLNCAGPWAAQVATQTLGLNDAPRLSLVQGGHIVTRRVNRTADAWMLQQPDGRIVFVIPYEGEYSLIGTTETPVDDPASNAMTGDEEAYLLAAVNRSLAKPLFATDIVHRFAGVRPLVLEEGKGARETTRDWQLVEHEGQAAMTVVGGKITTYRLLAEAVLARLYPASAPWTRTAPLPGGDIPRERAEAPQAAFARWSVALRHRFQLYDPRIIDRMARLYGTRTEAMLEAGLGRNLGGVFEAELQHMRDREWAKTAHDVLWRRSKLGLHLNARAMANVQDFFGEAPVAQDERLHEAG